MKKMLSIAVTGLLAASAVIAAPLAAQAAPKTLDLPNKCETIFGTKKVDFKLTGAIRADVHPAAGKEYTYAVSCMSANYTSSRELLVVTSSSGKVLATKNIAKNSAAMVTSASAKSGIKFSVLTKYKGSTTEWRMKTAKWNKSSKTLTIKNSARAKFLPSIHKLSTQMEQGKKITAVSASSSNMKKLNTFAKPYSKAMGTTTSCVPTSSTKGICVMMYVKGSKMPAISYNVTKKGSKYVVSNVKKTSADAIFG